MKLVLLVIQGVAKNSEPQNIEYRIPNLEVRVRTRQFF